MPLIFILAHFLLTTSLLLRRTISVTTSNTGGNVTTVSYTFDAAGNKKTETTGSGTLTYDYDYDDRLTMTHFSAAGLDETAATIIASQSYDRSGNLAEKVDYTAGSKIERTTYAYDLLNRLISVVNMNTAGLVISTYSYNLDSAGKRISVNDLTGTTYYDYDNNGRLISENGPVVQSVSYVYDAVGNRTAKLVKGVQVQGFQYDADDRVTNAYTTVGSTPVPYTYDNNGNLLSDGVRTFAWDFENKMYASGVVGNTNPTAMYTYNADGIRVQLSTSSGSTNYTIDADRLYPVTIEERDASNNLLRRYDNNSAHIDNMPDTIRVVQNGIPSYYIADGLGSTRQFVDQNGNVTDSWNYDAFGHVYKTSGVTFNSLLFDNQAQDATGLYYLRNRYMNPDTGVMLSRDNHEGNQGLPLTLQKYLYAGDDPVDNTDPSGNDFSTSDTLISSSIASGLAATTEAVTFNTLTYTTVVGSGTSAVTFIGGQAIVGGVTSGEAYALAIAGIGVAGLIGAAGGRGGEVSTDDDGRGQIPFVADSNIFADRLRGGIAQRSQIDRDILLNPNYRLFIPSPVVAEEVLVSGASQTQKDRYYGTGIFAVGAERSFVPEASISNLPTDVFSNPFNQRDARIGLTAISLGIPLLSENSASLRRQIYSGPRSRYKIFNNLPIFNPSPGPLPILDTSLPYGLRN